MPIYIEVEGIDNMIDAIERIETPSWRLTSRLQSAHRLTFLDVQGKTHVITGSLKLSETTSTDYDGRTWEGHITAGGPSPGPNNPVNYAIYEMARGGEHNFFRDIPLFYRLYEEAIMQHYREGMEG